MIIIFLSSDYLFVILVIQGLVYCTVHILSHFLAAMSSSSSDIVTNPLVCPCVRLFVTPLVRPFVRLFVRPDFLKFENFDPIGSKISTQAGQKFRRKKFFRPK